MYWRSKDERLLNEFITYRDRMEALMVKLKSSTTVKVKKGALNTKSNGLSWVAPDHVPRTDRIGSSTLKVCKDQIMQQERLVQTTRRSTSLKTDWDTKMNLWTTLFTMMADLFMWKQHLEVLVVWCDCRWCKRQRILHLSPLMDAFHGLMVMKNVTDFSMLIWHTRTLS